MFRHLLVLFISGLFSLSCLKAQPIIVLTEFLKESSHTSQDQVITKVYKYSAEQDSQLAEVTAATDIVDYLDVREYIMIKVDQDERQISNQAKLAILNSEDQSEDKSVILRSKKKRLILQKERPKSSKKGLKKWVTSLKKKPTIQVSLVAKLLEYLENQYITPYALMSIAFQKSNKNGLRLPDELVYQICNAHTKLDEFAAIAAAYEQLKDLDDKKLFDGNFIEFIHDSKGSKAELLILRCNIEADLTSKILIQFDRGFWNSFLTFVNQSLAPSVNHPRV
jgi:hypothetical protein